MRCFLALDLPDEAVSAIERAALEIRYGSSAWRDQKWVARENLHVTIAFLGEVDPTKLPALKAAVSRCTGVARRVSFGWSGLAAAPRASGARMLWVTGVDDGATAALAGRLSLALRQLDVELDARRFRLHATLVRARRPLQAPEKLDAVFAHSGLNEIVVSDPPLTLYSSRLTPNGPEYVGLASWVLGGAG